MSRHPFQNFTVHYGTGSTVFDEGDLGATMFIVQSGRVRLFRTVEGQRRELGEMEKGDFFGEMSILEGLPRTTSAEAVEASALIEINTTTFDKMVRGNIEIAIRLMRKLSIRLREAERRLEDFQQSGLRAAAPAHPTTARATTIDDAVGARLESTEEGVAYALTGDETLIGRFDPVTELNPDIDLTDVDLKRSVSRRHARILREGDSYTMVEELGALNGTFVNGTKLVTGKPEPVADGDTLSLGMVKLLFRA